MPKILSLQVRLVSPHYLTFCAARGRICPHTNVRHRGEGRSRFSQAAHVPKIGSSHPNLPATREEVLSLLSHCELPGGLETYAHLTTRELKKLASGQRRKGNKGERRARKGRGCDSFSESKLNEQSLEKAWKNDPWPSAGAASGHVVTPATLVALSPEKRSACALSFPFRRNSLPSKSLCRLWQNSNGWDAIVSCSGVSWYVHRAVLRTESAWFAQVWRDEPDADHNFLSVSVLFLEETAH